MVGASDRDNPPELERIFPGDSEMASRMRSFDWSKSELGSPESWPHNLRFAISICLTSRFPILLWWGPNLNVLYNDAYIPFLGETKHPRALARPGQQVWSDIWDPIGPMLEGVRSTGQAIWSGDFPFFFGRQLPREEVYVRFGFSPILGEDGRTVEGIFTGTAHLPQEHVSPTAATSSPAFSTRGALSFVEEALGWLPDEDDGPWTTEHSSIVRPHAVSHSPSRILLADDNADMRQYLHRLLVEQQYEVEAVADGEAALSAVRAHQPDLVIADVMMPRLDGFVMLRKLRADPLLATTPVILLSARAGEESGVEGLAAGADDYLVKPFSARELLARVEGTIALTRLRREARLREEELQADIANVRESMHQEIESQRTLLQMIFDATLVGIAIVDRDMRLIDFNDEYDRLVGPAANISRGQVLYNMYPATLEQKPIYDRVLAGESIEQNNVAYPYSGEEVRYRDASYRPVRDAKGKVAGLLSTIVDITKRKRAEEALRESEERFRSYFELGLIGMAITSPTKGLLEVNDEICRILGYERDELLQTTWAQMTHPDDLAADAALFERVMSGEVDGYSIDKRWIRKDGQIIDSNISVKCLRRADNSVDYFVALLQDITERKQAEQALRDSEARFRAVADLVPDLLWSRNAQGTVEWYNQQWTEYTGHSSEESAGFGWADVIHPDDLEQSLTALQSALSSGQPLRQERRIRGKDGSYRWFLVQMQPLRDESGRIVHWFAAATDIEEERVARDDLEERVEQRTAELAGANAQAELQRQRLHEVVMQIPAVVAVLRGPKHRYELVNPTLLRSMNKREEDVIGKTFGEIFPEGIEQGWVDAADRVYRTGKSHVAREAHGWLDRHEDGSREETYWNSIAVPLRDANGEVEGLLTHGVEVTDQVRSRRQVEGLLVEREEEIARRKEIEEELRSTNQRLRELSVQLLEVQEAERRYIARELHDEIGQQVTALRFMLEGLGRATPQSAVPTGQHPADQKTQQPGNALAIVDSLAARVRELSLTLRPPMLDDLGLGPGLLWLAERYTAQAGIEVKLAHRGLEDRLPVAIETGVYRIVQEALTNVARHAEVLQVTVQIMVDGQVTVLVEDTGKGFDLDEVLARHTTTGLSGMRERVELLGGQFLLESHPGTGTRIMAEIPLTTED